MSIRKVITLLEAAVAALRNIQRKRSRASAAGGYARHAGISKGARSKIMRSVVAARWRKNDLRKRKGRQ